MTRKGFSCKEEMERCTVKPTKSTLMAWTVLFVNTLVVHAETTNDRMDWFRDAKFGMFMKATV